MKPHSTFSPVSLRYIAALRGNKPKRTGAEFTYADAACSAPENLICLAASNPEGRFYGFVADETTRRAAEEQATHRGVFNTVFLVGSPSQILARLDNGSSLPPMLDYLCSDESAEALPASERVALFDLAGKRLNPGGLFVTSYRANEGDDGAMRFLVQELAPEMNADQKVEFLGELKKLGGSWLARHKDIAAKLDEAIAKASPAAFLALFDGAQAKSATFETQVAMGGRGLLYGGDAVLTSNYVELSIPKEAQDLVVKCRPNLFYEAVKDLALDRPVRSDIWVRGPWSRSLAPTNLFGGFAYGITMPREQVPVAFKTQGATFDLSAPLYGRLIDLMAVMPIGVGDFLSHPSGTGANPEKVIEALQVLVACGIASPMRGIHGPVNHSSVAQPRLIGSFNRYLDKTDITDKDVWFASSVMGCGVELPARDAFVMQALNRAGLSNSVSALMPELRRIAHTPTGMKIMQADEPTPEMAQSLVRDVVGKSLPQWYAYALLGAA